MADRMTWKAALLTISERTGVSPGGLMMRFHRGTWTPRRTVINARVILLDRDTVETAVLEISQSTKSSGPALDSATDAAGPGPL